jgi:hypothetical protein
MIEIPGDRVKVLEMSNIISSGILEEINKEFFARPISHLSMAEMRESVKYAIAQFIYFFGSSCKIPRVHIDEVRPKIEISILDPDTDAFIDPELWAQRFLEGRYG